MSAFQVPFMEVSMLISFKQNTSVAKVVQVYISKLNVEMIDILRKLYFPSAETAGRYRKISGCHIKGCACLMDEKIRSLYILNLKFQASSHRLCLVVESGLCWTWSKIPKTSFLMTRLK